MKRFIALTVFLILWGGWFLGFPYYIRWIEGISFFSTLPDFTTLHLHLPGDIFSYAGAFLLQFYAYPAVGAAIQAAFPLLCVMSLASVIRRIFKDPDDLEWTAFLTLPLFVYILGDDINLARSCMSLTCFCALAIIAYPLGTIIKTKVSAPRILRNRWIAVVLPLAAAVVSVYFIYNGPVDRAYDEIGRLEYLGKHRKWEDILEEVSPKDAARDELKRKYALLALSETGRLTDEAFRYGLSGAEDFIFADPKTIMKFNFNMLFYRSLEMWNPIVRMAYQQETLSPSGLSFNAVRTLADIYLKEKDYTLAKKYIDILSHSTCHKKWVRERLPELEAIRNAGAEYRQAGSRFSMQTLEADMWAMIIRHPDNSRYADYYLCGVLAEKDGNKFYKAFRTIAPELYPDGKNIPRLYQEALCPIAGQFADQSVKYHIDDEVWKSFLGFNELISKGRPSEAKRKYSGTYWTYVFF